MKSPGRQLNVGDMCVDVACWLSIQGSEAPFLSL